MIGIAVGSVLDRLDWSAFLWGGLWAGLVTFTLGLSFLLWTRWGDYHLTGKCVIFSLLAHLLLGLFFATAEVVEDVVVAMQWDAEHEPITIEHVKITRQPEELDRESNLDGQAEEVEANAWDRPSTHLLVESPMQAREAMQPFELANPERAAARETLTLPMESPRPELPLATIQPDEPAVTRSIPETPERTPSIALPDDSAARTTNSRVPTVPDAVPSPPSPGFAAAPVERERPTGADPNRAGAASGSDRLRVPPARMLGDNPPAGPSGRLESPLIRPDRSAKLQSESASTGSIATPESIAQMKERSPAGSVLEPSSSVRISPSAGTGGTSSDNPPKRSSSGAEEKIELPRARLDTSGASGLTSVGTTPKAPRVGAFRPTGRPPGSNVENADRDGVRLGTPEIYRERMNPNRSEQAVTRGGSRASEEAVTRALEWLAAHQQSDGHWDVDEFQTNCPPGQTCSGTGSQNRDDCAVTGLVLLAFLGAGNTHWEGKFPTQVLNGLNWLISQEKPNGDLRGTGRMYSQGIATLALSEALAMSADPKLREPVQRAINFIVAAQNASTGGWRYLPGQYGDTSIFGWQLMALKSASLSGIDIPETTWQRARNWLTLVGSGRHRGLAAYQPTEPATPTMTAEALVCRVFLGDTPTSPALREGADYLMQYTPHWSRLNLYYWYYGTLATFQMGGSYWQKWNSTMRDVLIEHQVRDGHAAGSWDPNPQLDPWGKEGGRVYSTALATLCLEVYYRFLPIQSLSSEAPSRTP